MDQHITEQVQLGRTDLSVSRMGIGTNSWGIQRQADPERKATFDAALEAGINLFDTAEVYDMGGSERTLGQFLPAAGEKVVTTTKFFPFPWRWSKSSLLHALRASLDRLRLPRVDLYLIHFPLPPVPLETWMEAMVDAKDAGLIRCVGVSNCSPSQMRRAYDALAKRGIPLACNQVEYSLLKRGPERNGLLQLCRELGVTLVAYRPIGSGLLSGRYTPENLPRRRRFTVFSQAYLEKIQPIIRLLGEIGETHGGKTPSQVALNWVMCKGALPIPGAKSVTHVQDNAGALGWELSEAEVKTLGTMEEQINQG